jgi:CTP synthase
MRLEPTRSSCTPARGRARYGEAVIYERHRHRYEVNNLLRKRLTNASGSAPGSRLRVSGTSPDERLVEVIELEEHPFFVASQFHPEFKSRPERPAPLFRGFIGSALQRVEAGGEHAEETGGVRSGARRASSSRA